jgi:uncharacterized membrane protein YbhN (UPF0104 family)
LWLCAALGAGLLLALIPTPLARRALQRASSLRRRLAPLGGCSLAPAATARATAIATGAAVINGAVFACVLGAFGSLTPRDAIIAAAAFNIAGAAGIAAVPVPSGIGVREAVLVTILHPIAPLEVIAGAAVLIRVAAIPMDVLLGALGAIWLAHRLPGADTLAVATPSQAEASAA